jgi:hypothetical protein
VNFGMEWHLQFILPPAEFQEAQNSSVQARLLLSGAWPSSGGKLASGNVYVDEVRPMSSALVC